MRLASLVLFFSVPVFADSNYHLVGWAHAFIPGAGPFLLGDFKEGGYQAAVEVSTFGLGYALSARSPMTLDGVPEVVPPYGDGQRKDMSRALSADILQEVGLKYHMVNVFESYREASGGRDPWIDPTPTRELFLAPFTGSILLDPTVYVPVALSSVALGIYYYSVTQKGQTQVAPLTPVSQGLYAFTYGAVYPFGSAAPEEMFYRGFIQNEARTLVDSPFFTIPLSTALFTVSHLPAEMPSAFLAGAWMGTLTYLSQGRLARGIAYHFWTDFLAGLVQIQLLKQAQFQSYSAKLINLSLIF